MPISGAFSLEGRIAVVTGGAAGIGLGIVQAPDEAGVRVLAVGRREDGQDRLRDIAPSARYLAADLAAAGSPAAILAHASEVFGPPDILVNNAAMLANRPLLDMTADYIDTMSHTNLRAALLLIKEFAALRRSAGPGGKVINIGSVEGYVATLAQGMAAYSATKTAIRGLTVTLARELAPFGIAVNGIVPGAIVHANLIEESRSHGLSSEQLDAGLEAIRRRTNTGRLGTPEDIAHACIFLASQASSYISGQMLLVDGGMTVTGG